jgi:MinD superfamily P-loop ATPase
VPVRELVVISGKGGTGKTSLAASLVELARDGGPVVAVDADVDASNLALILDAAPGEPHDFVGGELAEVDGDLCDGCGVCVEACRFGAVRLVREKARVDPLACDGCRVCRAVCPVGAVTMRPRVAGVWRVDAGAGFSLVHAELGVARDNSGKLVARVRREARAVAERTGSELIVIDGPPGIGCPVHAAVTGADLVLIVTEPSPSGLHDLERALDTCAHFKRPAAVVVNKADLAPDLAGEVAGLSRRRGVPYLGGLPFDRRVCGYLSRGLSLVHLEGLREPVVELWGRLREMLYA